MTDEAQSQGQAPPSPRIALGAVKRTQKALELAQRKADAAMAEARSRGFSFRDIADAADCSHMTVRTRIANFEAEKSEHA